MCREQGVVHRSFPEHPPPRKDEEQLDVLQFDQAERTRATSALSDEDRHHRRQPVFFLICGLRTSEKMETLGDSEVDLCGKFEST